jgi:hypothetical protein
VPLALHPPLAPQLPFIVKRLDEHKILSMPVCTFGRNVFSGFVDIADCVRYVTTHFSNANPQTWEDFDRLWRNIDGFSATTVEQVMQTDAISQGNLKVAPVHPIPAGYSLFSAFETIARGGYERVAVVNAEGQISTIISQSMLVDFLAENIELLGDLRGRRVSDFVGLHAGAPCLVKESDRVISGFKKMRRWGVSGLGVVNDAGALVDVLSERDLRGNKLDAVSFWGAPTALTSCVDCFSIPCLTLALMIRIHRVAQDFTAASTPSRSRFAPITPRCHSASARSSRRTRSSTASARWRPSAFATCLCATPRTARSRPSPASTCCVRRCIRRSRRKVCSNFRILCTYFQCRGGQTRTHAHFVPECRLIN